MSHTHKILKLPCLDCLPKHDWQLIMKIISKLGQLGNLKFVLISMVMRMPEANSIRSRLTLAPFGSVSSSTDRLPFYNFINVLKPRTQQPLRIGYRESFLLSKNVREKFEFSRNVDGFKQKSREFFTRLNGKWEVIYYVFFSPCRHDTRFLLWPRLL